MKKKKSGKRPWLTKEIQDDICKLLKAGNYKKIAAQAVGIAESTFYKWMKRGEDELARLEENPDAKPLKSEEKYIEFVESVKNASAEGEARHVININKAAEKDWHASGWILERMSPERWGRKTQYAKEDMKQLLQIEKMKLDIERQKLELAQMRGEDSDDAHNAIKQYAKAIHVAAEDLFGEDENDHDND